MTKLRLPSKGQSCWSGRQGSGDGKKLFKRLRSSKKSHEEERKKVNHHKYGVELDEKDVELIKYVIENNYTMTSIPRLVNTLKSCRYVIENNIPGDFVEAGVWRGGNGILAKTLFERMGSDKRVWMYDTFQGMTEPGVFDVKSKSKMSAIQKYNECQNDSYNDWCYASIDDVKQNCISSNLNLDGINFIQGDICETLKSPDNIPENICILRLDTDWYESTKIELEVLYPILSRKGVLILDDYGSWEGSRKATDEYFSGAPYKPLFHITDSTGRSAIKA